MYLQEQSLFPSNHTSGKDSGGNVFQGTLADIVHWLGAFGCLKKNTIKSLPNPKKNILALHSVEPTVLGRFTFK